MRKQVKASSKYAVEVIKKLPVIYLIACWASYGVQEYHFSGKCTKEGIPLVWQYDDFNGTIDDYFLRPLTQVTTGWIYAWTVSKTRAELIAEAMNKTLEHK